MLSAGRPSVAGGGVGAPAMSTGSPARRFMNRAQVSRSYSSTSMTLVAFSASLSKEASTSSLNIHE